MMPTAFACLLMTIALQVLAGLSASSVSPQRPEPFCPPGFTLNGKICQRLELADINLECSKGARLQQGVCHKTVLAPSQLTCPPGYTLRHHDKKCEKVERIDLRVECDKDYIIDGDTCTRIQKSAITVECPKGYHLEGATCVTSVKLEPKVVCPPGSRRNDHKCERVEWASPQWGCSLPDYIQRDGMCVKEHVAEKRAECGRGFQRDDTACVRRVDIPGAPQLVCPPQTVLTTKSNNKRSCDMVAFAPAVPTCKKDFTVKGDRCIQVAVDIPEFVCEKKYKLIDGGRCERRVEFEGQWACPPGTLLDGKKCYGVESTPVMTSCPKDYYDDADGRCRRAHRKKLELTCPKGFKIDEDGAAADYGVLEKSPPYCTMRTEIQPDYLCPHGTLLQRKYCESTELLDATVTCKHGGVVNHGVCIETSTKAPRMTCPKGTKQAADLCVAKTHVKPQLVCSYGTLRDDACEVLLMEPPVPSCPKGFSISTSGRCQRIHAMSPKPFCPQGMKLDGGVCVDKKLR